MKVVVEEEVLQEDVEDVEQRVGQRVVVLEEDAEVLVEDVAELAEDVVVLREDVAEPAEDQKWQLNPISSIWQGNRYE